MKVVAGLGFRAGCELASLRSALQAALELASTAHGQPITFENLAALATAADKAQHPALLQLAAELLLPVHPVPLPALAAQPAAPSGHVPERYGAHSLAEAAALAGVALIRGHAPVPPVSSVSSVRAEPVEALRQAQGERSSAPMLLGHRSISPDRMATAALAFTKNTTP